MVETNRWERGNQEESRAAVTRCIWCGEDIRAGEAYYRLSGQALCGPCLPLAAPALLLPFRTVAGAEEAP